MQSGTDVFGIKANLIPNSDIAGRKLVTTILANHAKVPDHGKNLSVLSAAARLWSSLSEAQTAEAGEKEATGDDAEEADKAEQTDAPVTPRPARPTRPTRPARLTVSMARLEGPGMRRRAVMQATAMLLGSRPGADA